MTYLADYPNGKAEGWGGVWLRAAGMTVVLVGDTNVELHDRSKIETVHRVIGAPPVVIKEPYQGASGRISGQIIGPIGDVVPYSSLEGALDYTRIIGSHWHEATLSFGTQTFNVNIVNATNPVEADEGELIFNVSFEFYERF